MRIVQVEISKFRSIDHLSLDAESLTVLCGANSSGKSNVLRAIRFAFVHEYSGKRMSNNFPLFITSGNAMVKVKLTFDRPTLKIATELSLSPNSSFTYEVNVKRSGFSSSYINGSKIEPEMRTHLLQNVWIVYVPPIRDISGDGLMPFKRMLGDAIRQARSGTTVASASTSLRGAVTSKGRQLLTGAQFPPIGNLEVDVAEVDFESMLSEAVINVRTPSGTLPLQGFGTGHQSQVVLGLYRQFGQGQDRFVVFQFEEPDNHMHATAMRAIADDLIACSQQQDSQVFITTHSPSLMNQFELRSAVSLVNNNERTEKRNSAHTLSDREYRVGLSQFGMRPAEALTARLVVVVEGSTDVTLIRTLYRHHHGRDPERDDVLIVPAGGKELAIKLCGMLNELGVGWRCILDYDAALNESKPYFVTGLTGSEKTDLQTAIDRIVGSIHSPTLATPKAKKILGAMRTELTGAMPPVAGFSGSPVSRLIDQVKPLSAADKSMVSKATIERKHSKWRDHFWRCGVWVWSADPEELLVFRDTALVAAETVLREAGVLTATFSDKELLREAVAGKLHSLAAEPEILERALRAIFSSGSLGTDQFNALSSRLRV